jgi:hydrogenase maturation factor
MIVISPGREEALKRALSDCGVKASCIGMVREAAFGIKLKKRDGMEEIMPPESDELYRVL